MNPGKYISSLAIIGNVLRDSQYTNLELSYGDGLEWCYEAADLIAVPKALRDDIECVKIHNYRGQLPCDFKQIIQCSGSINGSAQFPMRGATNTFHPVFTCDREQVTTLSDQVMIIDANTPVGVDINGNPVWNFVGSNTDDTAMPLATDAGNPRLNDVTYKINDNYIFTSFKDGVVYMAYKAFPVDKEGFPLIPDNIKYKKAVQTYITMKIDYQMWRRGDLTRDIFEHSEREWCWYCGAAQNSMRIPSIDEMESWKNQFMRLIPQLNSHDNYFQGLNIQEQLTFGKRVFYNGFSGTQFA